MIDRVGREGPDPLLDWKLRLFFAGAAVLILSMVLDRRPLALVAIGVLGLGMVLVLIDRVRHRRQPRWVEDDEPEEDGPAAP